MLDDSMLHHGFQIMQQSLPTYMQKTFFQSENLQQCNLLAIILDETNSML